MFQFRTDSPSPQYSTTFTTHCDAQRSFLTLHTGVLLEILWGPYRVQGPRLYWPSPRQATFPLYYCSSPSITFFTHCTACTSLKAFKMVIWICIFLRMLMSLSKGNTTWTKCELHALQ